MPKNGTDTHKTYLNRIIALTIIALLLVLCPVTASSAYAFNEERIDLTITRFLDSLSFEYKGFDIKLYSVSLGEQYDDNITFFSKNKEDDFITYPGIGFGVTYEGKRRSLSLVGDIIGQFFAKNTDLSNITQNVTIDFTNEFSKHDRLSLTNIFSHYEAPIYSGEEFFDEQLIRVNGRYDSYRNRFNMQYEKDISRQFTAIARYESHIDAFSGIDRPASFLNKIGTEANYLFGSNTIFLFLYDYLNRQFDNGEDIEIHSPAMGIRQYITKKTFFEGTAGFNFIDTSSEVNTTQPFYTISANYRRSSTFASLAFVRRHYTNAYSTDIFDEWKVSIFAGKQLLKRLRTSFTLFYGDGEFVSSGFSRRVLGGRTNLTYDISKTLKGDINYTYTDVGSNIKTAEYEKNTIFLGFRAEF